MKSLILPRAKNSARKAGLAKQVRSNCEGALGILNKKNLGTYTTFHHQLKVESSTSVGPWTMYKGQIISKGLFGILGFFQKANARIRFLDS